jgi:hypothetical protein
MRQHWRNKIGAGRPRRLPNVLGKLLAPQGSRVPLLVVGGLAGVLVLLCGWVLVCMGTPPVQTTVDAAVQL